MAAGVALRYEYDYYNRAVTKTVVVVSVKNSAYLVIPAWVSLFSWVNHTTHS